MTTMKYHQARVVLLVSLVVTALLYLVPYFAALAYPFMLLSTVAHEMGHGLTAMLVGGSFQRFEMWSDGSGVAHVASPSSALARAAVAGGGLVGPAVAAAAGFAWGRTVRGARSCLLAFAFMLLVALLLVVRGFFGFFFVALVAACCAAAALRAAGEMAQLVLVFFSVQLALSVFSRGSYLFTPVALTANGRMPSDVGQIAQALLLPYWFWGAACGLVSLAVLVYGLKVYWRR